MAEIHVARGYSLNLAGKPAATVADLFPRQVGIRPADLGDVKWRLVVKEGDAVQTGSTVLECKAHPELKVTSSVTGSVSAIRRGARRALLGIVIDCQSQEQFVDFGTLSTSTSRDQVLKALLASGLFARIRQHPFQRLPNPADMPKGIYVSAVASQPLAGDIDVTVRGQQDAVNAGIAALAKLTSGKVHLSRSGDQPAAPEIASARGAEIHTVIGKHPAGSPVVQSFYVDRVKPGEVIWHLGIQDLVAIGRLALTGKLSGERIIALAGNGVAAAERKLYRTRVGVLANQLTNGKLNTGEQRLISGDVLTGQRITADDPVGLYDDQLTVIPEGRLRQFIGWMLPGSDKYSYSRAFLSATKPADTEWSVDTNLHGGHRACIQCGYCNDVCPTDVMVLPTWKAVSYGDLEEAEKFGITDCAGCGLCTYVCPSKIEIDSLLHEGLAKIQKEG